ncbi:MAG: hypothetical protein ACR2RV_18490 [Verrucomicrobiales bacterium]
MSEIFLFIVGVGVFTVTLMAVLWTGYLVFSNNFDADRTAVRVGGDGDIEALDVAQTANPERRATL